MATSGWGKRFLTTTRGRILSLLRRSGHTVNELAQALGLTDNAVRVHLATLERDGLIQQSGSQPSSRKPNLIYALTPGAEQFFPKPYGLLLQQLLTILVERFGEAELEEILAALGRRLAASCRAMVQGETPSERVRQAVAVLGELGGLAEIEERAGEMVIRGFDCPLTAAVASHPCACRLAEAMLVDLVGMPVEECCNKQGTLPRCEFRVKLADSGPPGTQATRNILD
jgi:predicted ArsR family transcriptional regulator